MILENKFYFVICRARQDLSNDILRMLIGQNWKKYVYHSFYIDFTPPDKGVKLVGYTEQPRISLFETKIEHFKFEINVDINSHDYTAI